MNKSHEFADPVSRGGAAAGFRALFRDAAPYITAHRAPMPPAGRARVPRQSHE